MKTQNLKMKLLRSSKNLKVKVMKVKIYHYFSLFSNINYLEPVGDQEDLDLKIIKEEVEKIRKPKCHIFS